jgi:hypothetical protein
MVPRSVWMLWRRDKSVRLLGIEPRSCQLLYRLFRNVLVKRLDMFYRSLVATVSNYSSFRLRCQVSALVNGAGTARNTSSSSLVGHCVVSLYGGVVKTRNTCADVHYFMYG